MIFGEEPTRVLGLIEDDPDFGVDRLASVILDYPSGHATFTCSTQLVPYQRMHLMGTTGRVEIEIPFNAPNDAPCRILIDDGESLHGDTIRVEEFPVLDQYTVQGDLFAEAIRTGGPAPTPLEEAVRNMEVIDAVFRSADQRPLGSAGGVGSGDGVRRALAARIRDALVGREAIIERKMFGGLGFLHHGNMCTGVSGDALIARLGDRADEALAEPYVRPF